MLSYKGIVGLAHAAGIFVQVLGQTHERLRRRGTVDGLADPPDGIRTELEIAPVIKAVYGTHQANITLLNQVTEWQPGVAKLAGDANHQAQVAAHHLLFGLFHDAVEMTEIAPQHAEFPATVAQRQRITHSPPGLTGGCRPSHSPIKTTPGLLQKLELPIPVVQQLLHRCPQLQDALGLADATLLQHLAHLALQTVEPLQRRLELSGRRDRARATERRHRQSPTPYARPPHQQQRHMQEMIKEEAPPLAAAFLDLLGQ